MNDRVIRIPIDRVMLSDQYDASWGQAVATFAQRLGASEPPDQVLVFGEKRVQLQAVFGCKPQHTILFSDVPFGHWMIVIGDA